MASGRTGWLHRLFGRWRKRWHKRWQQRSAARELDGLRRQMVANRATAAAQEEALRPTLSLAIAALAVASALVVVAHDSVDADLDASSLAVVVAR